MIELPDELLEFVFLKLELKDLLSAIGVCQRWKCLITQSTRIFEKYPLVLDNYDDFQFEQKRNVNDLLNSNRKFSVLKIHHKRQLDFKEIIQKLGHNIRKLELFACHFLSVNHLRIILRFLPKLETLSVDQVTIEKFDDCKYLNNIAIPVLSLPKLRTIKLNECNSKVLSLFLDNECIKVFELRVNHSPEYGNDFKIFIDFLTQQTFLKVLEINNVSSTNGNFYDVNIKDFITFKLESLEIRNCSLTDQNAQRNFVQFLETQTSLREIKILDSNLPDEVFLVLLRRYNKLRTAHLDMKNFEYFYDKSCVNESIRDLQIHGNFASENQPTFNSIIRKFPNTRKLHLVRYQNLPTTSGVINDKFIFSTFINFKNLRELHIQGLTARTFDTNFANLNCLEIEHLKVFVIDNIKIDVKYNDWKNLIKNLKFIETLVIKRAISGASSEIIDLFISNLKYLRHLELGKGVINSDILYNIINSTHKLKVLKICKSDYEKLRTKFDFTKVFESNQLLVYFCNNEYFY
jgi:hypothetical protein